MTAPARPKNAARAAVLGADPNRLPDALAGNGRLATVARKPGSMQVARQAHAMRLREIGLGGACGAGREPALRDCPATAGALPEGGAAGRIDPVIGHRIGCGQVPSWRRRLHDRRAQGGIVARLG